MRLYNLSSLLLLLFFFVPSYSESSPNKITTTVIRTRRKPLHHLHGSGVVEASSRRRADVATIEECVVNLRSGGITKKQKSELLGVSFFVVMDFLFRKLFLALGIKFPPQLGGCVILFSFLIMSNAFICSHMADAIFTVLIPGSDWLAKWLPVFFVPGLALLPLAPSLGTPFEIVKVISVVFVGFIFSLLTTVYAVQGVSNLLGETSEPPSQILPPPPPAGGAQSPPKPFTKETLKALLTGCVVTGAMSVGMSRANHSLRKPVETLFMIFTTVGGYVLGARFPSSFTKVIHPLVTSTALTLGMTQLLGFLTNRPFDMVLKAYKSGSLSLMEVGAGDILMYMLGPSVVSLCIPMYSRKKLMKENLPVVGTSMITAAVGGLFGTAAYVRLINMASRTVRLSVLSRNVTTALAIAITTILGGNVSIASSVVVLTGILGATIGRSVLDAFNIKNPVQRGLGIGGSAQGLGVVSLVPEKDAFPFAAVSMVLTAICATCLVSIPSVKDAVVELAGGV